MCGWWLGGRSCVVIDGGRIFFVDDDDQMHAMHSRVMYSSFGDGRPMDQLIHPETFTYVAPRHIVYINAVSVYHAVVGTGMCVVTELHLTQRFIASIAEFVQSIEWRSTLYFSRSLPY